MHPSDLSWLVVAILTCNLEKVKELAQNNPDLLLERVDQQGNTVLHLAVSRDSWFPDDLAVIRYLVEECRVDLNAVNQQGKTALYEAAAHGHLPVVKYLIEEWSANPNVADQFGTTALSEAAGWGHLPVVKYLIEECDANPNVANRFGATALHKAAGNEQVQMLGSRQVSVVRYLLAHNADSNARDSAGETPLHCAARSGELEIVQQLMAVAPLSYLEIKNEDGKTAIDFAREMQYPGIGIVEAFKQAYSDRFMLFALGRHKEAGKNSEGENSKVQLLVDDVMGVIHEQLFPPVQCFRKV